MEARELRLGNLVYMPKGLALQSCRTEEFDDLVEYSVKSIYFNHDWIASVKPIPLTEEWLIRAGFELKRKQYSLNVCNELFRYAIKDQFVIWDSNGSSYLKIRQQGNGWLLRECYSRNDLVYKYVHQFQNLYFALTNEELTLKTE